MKPAHCCHLLLFEFLHFPFKPRIHFGVVLYDLVMTGAVFFFNWKSATLLPRLGGAFDLRLAVSVPLPIVMGIFVLLWFQSRLT